MTLSRHILLRRILLCRILLFSAAASLLAPSASMLAVDLHERLAAHHDGHQDDGHHDDASVGHGHFHGLDGSPDGRHGHHDASGHGHESRGNGEPSLDRSADHDPHDHETRSASAGLVPPRDTGPIHPRLASKAPSELPCATCTQMHRSSDSKSGVGPPVEPGLVPYLHCSLLI